MSAECLRESMKTGQSEENKGKCKDNKENVLIKDER